jgi:hypothetical protein
MPNKIKNILAWFLLIWGLLFFVITTISIFLKLDFWDVKETSFYLERLIYVIVFILIPMITGSILLSNNIEK